MASQTERTLVRILIGAALLLAIVIAVLAPASALPAVALGQMWLYRLEVSLLIFYSCLLLITPAFSGLIRGRLPIEISTRGAKFSDEANQSAELATAAIERLEQRTRAFGEALTEARTEIDRLKQVRSDNT